MDSFIGVEGYSLELSQRDLLILVKHQFYIWRTYIIIFLSTIQFSLVVILT